MSGIENPCDLTDSKYEYSGYLNDSKYAISDHHDWPLPDEEMSLDVYDLPRKSLNVEWWCCNGHVNDSNNNRYSIFALFVRFVDSCRSTCYETHYLHALMWGIIDVNNHEYYSSSLLDRQFIQRLLNERDLLQNLDEHLVTAYREMLLKHDIPLPDRLCAKDCSVQSDKLRLDYDDNLLFKDDNGYYHLHCSDPNQKISLTLEMQPLKAVCKLSHDDVEKMGLDGDLMSHYWIPRLKCNGNISIDGKSVSVSGQAWYDRTFFECIKNGQTSGILPYFLGCDNKTISVDKSTNETFDYTMYSLSIQLDNEYDIIATYLADVVDHSLINKSLVIIGPNNEHIHYNDDDNFQLKPLDSWTSIRTTCSYSTSWKLSIPNMNCELYVKAVFQNQEFLTILNQPGFWQGRMTVDGTMNGQVVKGDAFNACHSTNKNMLQSLDHFFKRISKITLMNIAKILPKHPTHEQTMNLVGNEDKKYLLDELNIEIFSMTMISPLRDIIDRGGKAWRSYICLLCMDCVGGNSTKYEHWLSLPEIVHVGSLIVDDIQDESDVRRGGPACHILHGKALAINSGTSAYFLSLYTLMEQTPSLTPELKLQIYETTFLTLRAAHTGQALDIHGLHYMMDAVVETGDSFQLEKAVLCTHRLKSGVPAGSVARMGALIGGGTKEQCVALENYMETIGLAFQIMDDVINLRGFERNTKTRGEDITAGKITFPIAKAMNMKHINDRSQREYVWNIIKSKTTDTSIVNNLLRLLEDCGCINESVNHARSLIEDGWTKVDSVIPNSYYKLFLRAFGLYVIERHSCEASIDR